MKMEQFGKNKFWKIKGTEKFEVHVNKSFKKTWLKISFQFCHSEN